MPRQRSPERDRAFSIWVESGKQIALKDIAEQLGVSPSQVRNWKVQDKWEDAAIVAQRNTNDCATKSKSGAPKGNRNAAGNIGGPGGPVGNKKAMVTGEHETISWDALDDDEKLLFATIDTDELAAIDRTIRMMEVRERRMLLRIKRLQEGPEMVDSLEVESEQDNPQFGLMKSRTTNREAGLERIQRIEEALTRIQEKKGKYIELRSKLVPSSLRDELERLRIEKLRAEIAKITGEGDGDDVEDDGFIDALKGRGSEVWGNDSDGSGDAEDGGDDKEEPET